MAFLFAVNSLTGAMDLRNWHAFRALKRFFLLDVLSNSLFAIEEPVYRYLNGEATPAGELGQIEADLAELRSQGFLSDEPETIPELNRDASLKALCLHISHDCNLRCRYCFAGTGAFGGRREQMSFPVGKAALDLLLNNSGKHRELEVDFFGGEPLLNFEVVRELVAYGEKTAPLFNKIIHFTLTTNGINLDEETRAFLNEHQIAVVLSLDGRPGVNDAMRGKGSYERAMPQFLDLVRERGGRNYYLRGTYTAGNIDFLADVKHLYDLGFRELSLEPVVDTAGDYRIGAEHLDRIKAEYERLAEYYLEQKEQGEGFTFFHFEVNLEHGPCLPKRLTGCGAGFDYFAVTPSGELYPCHQFVGRTEFRMGDIHRGVARPEMRREFGQATLYQKEGCAECWARFYCSGGCHANAHLMNGSIYKPDAVGCELQRKRLECALALKGMSYRAE